MRLIRAESLEALPEAVRVLSEGGIIAFPTETYYALGARFDDDAAVRRIYRVKGRPRDKAMPIIIGSAEGLAALGAEPNEMDLYLMKKYWPGPLTLLMGTETELSDLIVSGGKVAVRVPGESFALQLAREAGFPITATSANPTGSPPARDVGQVMRYFDETLDLLIDGGSAPGGMPSTIVDTEGYEITVLRPGAVEL